MVTSGLHVLLTCPASWGLKWLLGFPSWLGTMATTVAFTFGHSNFGKLWGIHPTLNLYTKHETLGYTHLTLNLNPKHEIRNTKHKTRNPEPGTRNSKI
ncbi:hypothetical protein T484DRAFT_2101540 [Baffinella frigidus]|nr:hypothetical protein T484DRAFT_2101540 [Cryptophyta sp. CCMP2293]